MSAPIFAKELQTKEELAQELREACARFPAPGHRAALCTSVAPLRYEKSRKMARNLRHSASVPTCLESHFSMQASQASRSTVLEKLFRLLLALTSSSCTKHHA